jgi:glycosidase
MIGLAFWYAKITQYKRSDWWAFNTANAFLMTTFGQPIVYYGAEQGFNGNCHLKGNNVNTTDVNFCNEGWHDITSRQSMFQSAGFRLGSSEQAIDDLAYLGLPQKPSKQSVEQYDWTRDPYLNRNHQTYQHLKRLIAIRKSCKALRYGRTQVRRLDNRQNCFVAIEAV